MESPEASTRSVMDVRAKPWLAKRARAGARSWAPRGARWAWLTLGIKERPFVFDGTVHDRPPKPTPREALMRYQTFGRRTGLRLSEYVLGTANFGSAPSAAGLAGSRAIFEAYVAAGGTTFDVSNIYQNGEAERVLGELLGRERDLFAIIQQAGPGSSRDDGQQPQDHDPVAGGEPAAVEHRLRGRLHAPLPRRGHSDDGDPGWARGPDAGRHPGRVQPARALRRAGTASDGRGPRTGCPLVLPARRRVADREVPPRRARPPDYPRSQRRGHRPAHRRTRRCPCHRRRARDHTGSGLACLAAPPRRRRTDLDGSRSEEH